MQALEFLRLILPPEGWYIGWARKKNPSGGEFTKQQALKTIEQLARWCIVVDAQGYDVYYAIASFKEESVWDAKKNKRVQRTHDNVRYISELPADIDTRISHAKAPYADQHEAAEAVVAFCSFARLPPPLWIDSGGGLHIHWPLAALLGLAEWQLYADGLAALAADFKLQIDARRTVDASSVLRPPGTHHHKTGRIVEASALTERYPLELFAHLKERGLDKPRASRVESHADRGTDSSIASTLIRSLGDEPSNPRSIARTCAQIGAFVANPGRFREPFHRGVAGLFKVCCPEGADIYLECLDPEFRSAGQVKLDGWTIDEPTTCAYFESSSCDPGLCKTCPHYGKITSPIWLGRQTDKKINRLAAARGAPIQLAAPIQSTAQEDGELNGFPILKPPWELKNDGKIVWQHEKSGEDVETIVCDNPIYVHRICNPEGVGPTTYAFRHKPYGESWETITVPASEFKNGQGIPTLVDRGALIREPKLFNAYMNEQLGHVNLTEKKQIRYEQCGFKHNNTAFLYGANLYGKGPQPTVEPAIVSDEIAARARLGLGVRAGADPRYWMSIYNQAWPADHYCAHLNYALSLGSILHPLHTITAGGVIVVNWTPESGKGKSLIIWTAGSVWGSKEALAIQHHDTIASIGLILAALGNLPPLIDEIQYFARGPDQEKLRLLTDMLAQGRDKHRALPHGLGVRHQLGNFGNHGLGTSNISIGDKIEIFGHQGAGDAAAINRLLELDARPPREFDHAAGDALEQELWKHHGAIGHAFLMHLMRDDVQSILVKDFPRTVDNLWKKSGLSVDHRVRMRALASSLFCAELLYDIGLWPVSSRQHIQDTFGWGIDQIKRLSTTIVPMTAPDSAVHCLDEFLRFNTNNTLRVAGPYRVHTHYAAIGQKPQKLTIRQEDSSRRMYFPVKEFRIFAVQKNYAWRDVENNLLDQKIALNMRRRISLGAGTEFPSAQIWCVEIDTGHPAVSSLLRESSEKQAP